MSEFVKGQRVRLKGTYITGEITKVSTDYENCYTVMWPFTGNSYGSITKACSIEAIPFTEGDLHVGDVVSSDGPEGRRTWVVTQYPQHIPPLHTIVHVTRPKYDVVYTK